MAYLFKDLQDEVKRRGSKDQGGTAFDDAIKNLINTSLFRVAREAPWRQLRRRTQFNTVTSYTTGSGAGSFDSTSSTITVTGATFRTDGIVPGRRIKLSGDTDYHTIKTITGETTLTIEENYGGTTTTTGTYEILPQEEYNLPIQCSHRMFMWHEEYGLPLQMSYVTDQDFYGYGVWNTITGIPEAYRMWGTNMAIRQPDANGQISISSTSASDTNIPITIFGTVASYPDYEVINTNSSNGTTGVTTTKSFSAIERVVKGSTTTGRISLASSGNTLVTIPVGDTTAGIQYSKVSLYPLPNSVFEMQVQYYKEPYRLVNDGDVHELGQEFDEAIILLATAKIKYEEDQKEGDKFFGLYQDELKSLKRVNTDKIDWIPKPKRAYQKTLPRLHQNLYYTQVGSYYGPTTR